MALAAWLTHDHTLSEDVSTHQHWQHLRGGYSCSRRHLAALCLCIQRPPEQPVIRRMTGCCGGCFSRALPCPWYARQAFGSLAPLVSCLCRPAIGQPMLPCLVTLPIGVPIWGVSLEPDHARGV